MQLINCKVELELRWMNYCLFSVLGVANSGNDGMVLILIILFLPSNKQNVYVSVFNLSGKHNPKL